MNRIMRGIEIRTSLLHLKKQLLGPSMNILTLLKSFLLLCMACVWGEAIFGQDIHSHIHSKTLSYNGMFIPLIPEGYQQVSDNGLYYASYIASNGGDEIRELRDVQLFKEGKQIFSLDLLPGSDLMISNAGMMAVFDTRFHFKQMISIVLINNNGETIFTKSFRYASLFGFSPSGKFFVVGTGSALHLINTSNGGVCELEPCSQFCFSQDERILVTAHESRLSVYQDFKLTHSIQTGLSYPRALAISQYGGRITVIGKKHLITYSLPSAEILFKYLLPEHLDYRDLTYHSETLMVGIHEKRPGLSKGILQVWNQLGEIVQEEVCAEKGYEFFEPTDRQENKSVQTQSIPWPFIPFNQMHTVWNYYEQHMGDGSSMWSYLHQGLDIITPVNEPTYAVQAGYVKCVLTTGGTAYWRVAISPVQAAGQSNGFLYAHLVPGSIQVEVGDYVNLHEYLGDIIQWSNNWGHLHFVEIHDQGLIWYYDDDEWGINFNPLIALTPYLDTIAPVIEDFSPNAKFGILAYGSTGNFLDLGNLSGNIEIIAKIADYHASSPWTLPAYETYYSIKELNTHNYIIPRTLGRRLNHAYSFYSAGNYELYAPLIYYKDFSHPPPSWMSQTRDYYQVLTRNNGDTLIDLGELYLSFPTAHYADGDYMIYVEAWDECGNASYDSMQVCFNNGNTSVAPTYECQANRLHCYPNPVHNTLHVRYYIQRKSAATEWQIITPTLHVVKTFVAEAGLPGWHQVSIDVRDLPSGIYFIRASDEGKSYAKIVILH